jgi:phage baseplate assembly protein W
MALDLRTLDAAYWQPKNAHLGEVASGIYDINQCIIAIISTPKGSDPHRPDFAVGLMDYMDRPITWVRPRLTREIIAAIAKWERRATVQAVVVSIDNSTLTIRVTWTPSGLVNTESAASYQTTLSAPASVSLVTSPFVSIPFTSTVEFLGAIDGGTA